MISAQQLTTFMKIYENRFGRKISREEARESAIKLIRMIEITYRPMPVKDYKNLQKRRKETEENN